MIKTLTKTGNSLAIILDKPLLERLGIDADTKLEVSTDGQVIVLSPVRDDARLSKLKQVAEDAHARYAGVFRRLAE